MVKVYLVGGAVRDHFLNREVNDRDYVVVGSNPQEMLDKGYTQVGKDFPVFLDPLTKEEYALARTERSTGTGHTGFECAWEGVTLEEDLSRRDLTINAIAYEQETHTYIDPFNGLLDIKNKVFRPVSEAFGEDPLRVLRLARFAAQLGEGWTLSLRDLEQVRLACSDGQLDSVPAERVWKEMEKALKSPAPQYFFELVYKFCPDFFPIINQLKFTPQNLEHHPEGDVWTHTKLVMEESVKYGSEVVFAGFCHDFGKGISHEMYGNAHGHEETGLPPINEFCDKWKVPNDYRKLALQATKLHTRIHGILGRGTNGMTTPKSIMKMFEEVGALTNLHNFRKILRVCQADAHGRGKGEVQRRMFQDKPYLPTPYLNDCLLAVGNLDTKSITKRLLASGKQGKVIGLEVRAARIGAIRTVFNQYRKA